MEILRFGLGIRFDFLTHEVTMEQVSGLLARLASVLPAKTMARLKLFGGRYELHPGRDEGVYTLVITNGSLKKMRALYRAVNGDAVLHGMLCSVSPYLQNNVIRDFEGLDYLGSVDENGVLSGGSARLEFAKKTSVSEPFVDKDCIIVAPNSFKGTFGAYDAARRIALALRRSIPRANIRILPVADGGDGTLEAAESALRGRKRQAKVTAPYGQQVTASYYSVEGRAALIESALASGLALCSECELDPKSASSFGTGELIRQALRDGLREIYIGLGGSATNDCGIGAASALGFRFLDAEGAAVTKAEDMRRVASIDASGAEPLIKNAYFTVMCDVENPLTGPDGATHTFGRQKGAGEEDIALLESGMLNMAKLLDSYAGREVSNLKGAGAAGGMGAAFMALLGAQYVSGADALLDMAHFDNLLKKAKLVITGEGKIDSTSVRGKATGAVAKRAAAAGVPVALIGGSRGDGAELLEQNAAFAVYCPDDTGSEASLDAAACTLAEAVRREFFN